MRARIAHILTLCVVFVTISVLPTAAHAAAVPGKPTGVTAAARPGGALVKWKAPTAGAPITGYVIKASPGGKKVKTAAVTSFLVGGLTNGTAYRFQVAAINASGTGAFSVLSLPVTPRPAAVPGLPKNVTASAGFKQVSVVWTAAANNASPVTSYKIKVAPGGATVTVPGQARTATVTGLANGVSYTLTVAAVNRVGTGPGAKSNTVKTRKTAPTAPILVQAGPTGSGLRVSWQPPAESGGSAITGYVVKGGGKILNLASSARSTVVTGLTAGTLYTFTVAARNAVGTGPAAKSPPATSDVELQDHVVVLSSDSLATLGQVLSDGTLQFTNPPAQVTGLQIGDIVVIGVTANTPSGMLAKVRYIAGNDPSTYKVGTEPTALDQVFKSAGFGAGGALGGGELARFQPAMTGVREMDKRVGLPSLSVSLNAELYKDAQGRSVKVSGSVSVDPTVDFSAHASCCFHLDSHFRGKVTTTAKLSVSADYDKSLGKWEKKLGTWNFTPIVIQVGPVPVVIRPTLDLSLVAKGTLSAGLRVGASATATMGADVTTHDATVTSTPINSHGATLDLPAVYGKVSANAGVSADLKLLLYGLTGPSLDNDLWVLKFVASPLDHPCWSLSVGDELNLKYKLDLLSRTWVDFQAKLLDVDWPLWAHQDPCLSLTVTPENAKTAPGQTVQFTAKLIGAQDPTVKWTAAAGTISSTGLYTAPSAPGLYKITATSPAVGLKPEAKGEISIRVGNQPPDPPTGVTATAGGKGEANVNWTPPAENGGSPITGYVVTASPDGQQLNVSGTTAHFTGLTPKSVVTFTVEAVSAAGTSLPSSPSNPVRISDGSDINVGVGNIAIKLIWDNDNDEDLHVIEPNGTEIWFRAKGPTSTGGQLDRDDNVSMCGNDPVPGGVENVYWPDGTTPDSGTYTVRVAEYSSCGTPSNWTAEVRIGDRLIKRISGVATGEFTFTYPQN